MQIKQHRRLIKRIPRVGGGDVLNTSLPEDLQGDFGSLEQQAVSTMRNGNYELAEKILKAMLETIMKRQEAEKRRIHKGSFFHNIGFSLALQNRLIDSLHNFLLAYIEDCLNTQTDQEELADKLPAARVLRKGFVVRERNLALIRNVTCDKKRLGRIILDPQDILKEILDTIDLNENDLFKLCAVPPSLDGVMNSLVVNLTPEASRVLNDVVAKRMDEVLRIAATIAKKKGEPAVTDDDVREAIEQLEGENK
jgi:hypothetical protein